MILLIIKAIVLIFAIYATMKVIIEAYSLMKYSQGNLVAHTWIMATSWGIFYFLTYL